MNIFHLQKGGVSNVPNQDTNIVLSSITTTSMTISWTNNGGTNHICVVRESSAVNSVPVNSMIYASDTVFGNGDQVGIFNYVVYNGTGNSVSITGLTSNTRYYVEVFAVNAYGLGTSTYNISTATNNPANQATSTLSDLVVNVFTSNNTSFYGGGNAIQYAADYFVTSSVINTVPYDQIQLEVNVVTASSGTNTRGYLAYSYNASPPFFDESFDSVKVIGTGLTTNACDFLTTGLKTTIFINIPLAAKSSATRILLIEKGQDGTTHPTINNMVLRLKQIPV